MWRPDCRRVHGGSRSGGEPPWLVTWMRSDVRMGRARPSNEGPTRALARHTASTSPLWHSQPPHTPSQILPLLQQLFGALDPRTSDVSSRVATAAPAPGAGIDFAPLDERDAAVLRSWDHRSFARLAAAEPELASRCALLLQQWCSVLSSAIIDEGSPASRRSTSTGGLAQEVTACRERRAALAAAVEHAQVRAWGSKGQGKDGRLTARWPSDEQGGWLHALRLLFQPQAHPLPAHCWPRPPCMQSDACRCVVGMASKGAAALEWRSQQQGLGEALSDAEDCLQYLEVVQELMQGLRSGERADSGMTESWG